MSSLAKNSILVLFLILLTGALAEVGLRLLSVRIGHIDYLFGKKSYFLPPMHTPDSLPGVDSSANRYNVYDPLLGWAIGKFGAQPPYYSDQLGYRCSQATHDSLKLLPNVPGVSQQYAVACLGNSFTHGDEVTFEDTWPYQLERITGAKSLNLGVGGYGIDQAFLRYLKEQPKSNWVILGLVAGDLDRAQTQIYNLTVGGLKTKPLILFDKDTFRVANRPAIFGAGLKNEFTHAGSSVFLGHERFWPTFFVWDWTDHLYLARTARAFKIWSRHRKSAYRTEGIELNYSVRIIEELQKASARNGARFVVLILDNLNTFDEWDKGGNPWKLFVSRLDQRNIEHWYYGDSFYRQFKTNRDAIINRGLVHYSPAANRQVAEFVSAQLQAVK